MMTPVQDDSLETAKMALLLALEVDDDHTVRISQNVIICAVLGWDLDADELFHVREFVAFMLRMRGRDGVPTLVPDGPPSKGLDLDRDLEARRRIAEGKP